LLICKGIMVFGWLLAFSLGVFAQNRVVMGTVSDNSMPVPGVNVLCKGTTTGTATDADGKYTLELPEGGKTLVFSFVGYTTTEKEVGTLAILDVQLQANATQLSEIVVTGTGVPIEKRKLAFAVETVSSEKLPIVPTSSIDQALVGMIPGAQISSINGTPGSEVSIMLRGINTINRGTMPMILVDGVQMGATTLSALDPNTIDKVEVIQGAAAATIYGAQGANGVIQVFTKKGKSGKMHISFSSSIANNELLNVGHLQKASHHGFLTNSKNEVVYLNELDTLVLAQDPATLLYNHDVQYDPHTSYGTVRSDLLNPNLKFDKRYDQNLQYHDHFTTFFKPANIYNSSLSISGGSDNIDYSLSFSKTRQESNYNGDGYNDRTNLTSNIGIELVKGLRLRSITQLIYTKNTISIFEKPDYGLGQSIYGMLNTRPFADYEMKDTDGNYGLNFGDAAGLNGSNPFYGNQYSTSLDKKVDILQNFNLTYSLFDHFDLELLYGINHQDKNFRFEAQNQSLNQNSNEVWSWVGWNNNADNTGEISVFNNERTFQNFKGSATAHFDLARNWKLPIRSVTQVTYDYRSDRLKRYSSYALGMPLVPPMTASRGTTFNTLEDYKEDFVTYGYLVNQRFEFGDVAGISGGFRTDFSSALGKGAKPFTFPRADGFFRLTGMDFWNNTKISKVILEWKLRAAYGEAGIQPGPFDRFVTFTPRTLGSSNALFIGNSQSNTDLSIEVSKEFEVGTDFMLDGLHSNWLRNFQFSTSWWKRKTDNTILAVDAPPSTGVGTVLDNALGLESQGIQASLNAMILQSSKLTWNMTANFSTQSSLVTAVKGGEIIVYNRILKAGEKVGQMFGRLMLHSIDQRNPDGEFFIEPDQQPDYVVASNGWVVNRYTKQPFITIDRFSMGDTNPKFMMTFINEISYRKFLTFSFQVDWLSGSHLYNNTKQWMYRDGVHSDYEKPITIDDVTGAWSAFYQGTYDFSSGWAKNYFLENTSFIRLRNISLGLDFAKLFKMTRLNKLQLALTGRNLWTKTQYTGMDPEISTYGAPNMYSGTTTLARGLDDASMPNFRTYQISLNIGL